MKTIRVLSLILMVAGIALVFVALAPVSAQDEAPVEDVGRSPLHPDFPLLDSDGVNVLESRNAVSTTQTCGTCHDADFISEHSFHADVGLSSIGEPGLVAGGRPWDTSPGLFGRWNPLLYQYDLTTPEWVQFYGMRHVGGGPAMISQDGTPLTELAPDAENPEASIHDADGNLQAWDWAESGVVEMNCFLCHLDTPDNEARVETLAAGDFGWANTATLQETGVVMSASGNWLWNEAEFNEDGSVSLNVGDPGDENCGQCHGLVHVDAQTPLNLDSCSADQYTTITTGQILSPQRISNSGLNIEDKEDTTRSFDVHAERVVACVDCHYALNNPIYFQETDAPEHLEFDPRRMDFGDYLYRPLHEFAKGQSAQGALAPEYDNSLRRCESCHDVEVSHQWLPYLTRHTEALACESCHVPELYAPSRQIMDWTVLSADGTPQSECRGVVAQGETFGTAFVSSYEPVLLPREDADGGSLLAPHNLITYWYWAYGEDARPVPMRDLEAVWLDGDSHPAEVIAIFDANADGELDESELRIESDAQEVFIAERLSARGLDNPRIVGEVQPYSINHNVTNGEWAVRDCQTCHTDDSRLAQPVMLAADSPNGHTPTFPDNPTTTLDGDIVMGEDGALYFQPRNEKLYVLGHDSVPLVDWIGVLFLLGTFAAVIVHGGVRVFTARQHVPQEADIKRVYMYTIYERQWHWLQSGVIFGLLLTGLIIHKPDMFGGLSFRFVVLAHNVFAAILVVNAALALFYHLASGEIRQFLPQPRGFFGQAIQQAKFYAMGIFKNDPHPFEKTPDHKLNPIQQFTYFMILNVLLPAQIITGALMWGAQQFPDVTDALGGLTVLGPLHSLVAWLFASFIVIHVYMTTTGHEPMANIRAMMMGWDEVEVHGDVHGMETSQEQA